MTNNIYATAILFLLSSTITLASPSENDIKGYGKSTWKMTPEMVLNAESPRAKALESPEKYKNGIGAITIEEIQIGTAKFKATFIFDESTQQLEQVNLASLEKKNVGINANSFVALEKLLIEKYGPPAFKNGTRTVSWKLPSTTIELVHLSVAGEISLLMVSYKPTAAAEAASKDL